MRLKLWTAAWVIATAAAGAAQAGDIGCVWDGLSPSTQASLMDRPDHLALGGTPMNDEFNRAAAACGFKDPTTVGQALAGYVLQQASARWLESNAHLSVARLDAAWATLAPDVRANLTTFALGASRAAPVKEPQDELVAIAKALDLHDVATVKQVLTYYVGREIRADNERRL